MEGDVLFSATVQYLARDELCGACRKKQGLVIPQPPRAELEAHAIFQTNVIASAHPKPNRGVRAES